MHPTNKRTLIPYSLGFPLRSGTHCLTSAVDPPPTGSVIQSRLRRRPSTRSSTLIPTSILHYRRYYRRIYFNFERRRGDRTFCVPSKRRAGQPDQPFASTQQSLCSKTVFHCFSSCRLLPVWRYLVKVEQERETGTFRLLHTSTAEVYAGRKDRESERERGEAKYGWR